MIRKTDWEAAARELIAEGRGRLGDPPSADDLQAYARGELPAEAAATIQEHLVHDPELVRLLAPPAELGGDLSDAELAQDWKLLKARLEAGRRHSLVERLRDFFQRPLVPALVTAVLAVVCAGLWLRVQSLEQSFREPRVPERLLLLPDGQRGAAAEQPPIPLPAGAADFLLVPALIRQPELSSYRLDIVRLAPPALVWSRTGLVRRPDDTFEIWVPRAFLAPGTYRLELYGLAPGRKALLLATYTLERSADGR